MRLALLAAVVVALGTAPAAAPRTAWDGCTPQAGDVSFRAPDGTRLAGHLFGHGRVGVVLAHQSDGDLCQWTSYGAHLAALGYTALAFDFRNVGSSGVHHYPGNIRYGGDVAGAVRELRRRGTQKVVLVGASLGGSAVIQGAANVRPLVAGVVSVSGAADLSNAIQSAPDLRVPVLYLAGSGDRDFAADARRLYAATKERSKRLLALDRLEQRLEVTVAEAARAVPFDHLEEQRGPVLRGLREDLQQVAVVVAVGEDAQPPQVVPALVDRPHALRRLVVVRVGRREEDHAPALERLDRLHDVRRLQGDVLRARAVVELEVLLDLALPLPFGRLVDRELDLPLAVRHHLRHQRRVLGRDVLVGEVDHLRHAEDALVELDPVLHAAELDVADDVVDREQPDLRLPTRCRLERDVAGEVRAFVVAPADERVHDVAVGRDRRELDTAELVLHPLRLGHALRTALHGLTVRLARVRDAQRDVLDPVAVRRGELADLVPATQRARDHEADVVLLEHVARAVADPRLRACVRRAAEPECVLVVEGGLLGVPHPELDVVPPVERHEVVAHRPSV